jgi:hypothetical protein
MGGMISRVVDPAILEELAELGLEELPDSTRREIQRDYERFVGQRAKVKESPEVAARRIEEVYNRARGGGVVSITDRVSEYGERLAKQVAEFCGTSVDDARRVLDDLKNGRDAVSEVTADTRLARLQARLQRRVREIELPEGGFTSKAQAKAAARLSTTFRDLQKVRAELELPPLEKPPEVREVARLRSDYVKHHTKTGEAIPRRRRGRPRRVAVEAGLPAR